jgi:hypothetical protein
MAGNVVRAKAHVEDYCRFNVECELLAATDGRGSWSWDAPSRTTSNERNRCTSGSFLFLSRRITQPNNASNFAQTLTSEIHELPNDHGQLSLSVLSNGRFAVRRSTGDAADWPGMWVISVGWCSFWRRGRWLTQCRRHNGLGDPSSETDTMTAAWGPSLTMRCVQCLWAATAFLSGVRVFDKCYQGKGGDKSRVP